MFFESTRWPGEVHVARALIEGSLDREPSAHVFYESHVQWLEVSDALPKRVSQASQAKALEGKAANDAAATGSDA